MSQINGTMPRPSEIHVPYQNSPKPRPNCRSPRANFAVVLGSQPRLPRNVHSPASTGPKSRM